MSTRIPSAAATSSSRSRSMETCDDDECGNTLTTSYQSFDETKQPLPPHAKTLRRYMDERDHEPQQQQQQSGTRTRRSPRHSDPLGQPSPPGDEPQPQPPQSQHSLQQQREDGSTTLYRGFSTSIADLFVDAQHERVDCCSVTCCGLLQHDRDRFLLTGVTPPSLCKRLVTHVLVPAAIFFAAGLAALRIRDALLNELMCTALLLLLVLVCGLQCAKGRKKRAEIRKDLLYTKYQIQQQHLLSSSAAAADASGTTTSREKQQSYQTTLAVLLEHDRPYEDGNANDAERDYYLGQTRRDIRSAHPCCMLLGCYAEDRPKNNNYSNNSSANENDAAGGTLQSNNNNNNDNNNDDNNSNDDICPCLFEIACPGFCGSHVQLCGMCALAQEARDLETCVLPAPYRRIDYITMQGVLQYYPAIYLHRHHHNSNNNSSSSSGGGCCGSGGGDRSRPLMGETEESPVTATTAAAAAAANHNHAKTKSGTFLGHPLSRLSYRLLQTLLLFLVVMLAWSCYGASYFWTSILGQRGANMHHFGTADWIVLLLTFGQAFALLSIWKFFVNRSRASELSMDAIIKYFASGFFLSASLALFWELMTAMVVNTFVSLLLAIAGVDQMDNPETDLAATTFFAHGSSYLTRISGSPILLARFYWDADDVTTSVSRPDYISLFGMDHPVLYTIYILVATFVVAGFIEELCKYFGFRMVEHPDFFSKDELEEATAILQSSHDEHDDDDDDDDEEASTSRGARPAMMDYSNQCESVQGRGAAITLAMVSVAIGFACCENLIYIFLYAGKSIELELGVLIERSFFPIHPILAAVQSIGVCQRELEGSRATKLGRIILPAVVFHGTFDFCIIFISFIGRLVGTGVEEGDLRISNTTEFLSVVSCVVVMFAALVYLYDESGKQRERLAAIDRQAAVDRSNLI